MKTRVDRPFSIRCIGMDALRKERISAFFLGRSGFALSFSSDPVSAGNNDIEVLPAAFLSSATTTIPAKIAFGTSSELNGSFLNGCDDFLKEPWEPEELYWKIARILKGLHLDFPWGKISISPDRASSSFGSVELTFHEYRLLSLLSRFRGEAVSRETLLSHVSENVHPGSRTVDMHVSALRKKLDGLTPSVVRPTVIRSVRNTGYMIP